MYRIGWSCILKMLLNHLVKVTDSRSGMGEQPELLCRVDFPLYAIASVSFFHPSLTFYLISWTSESTVYAEEERNLIFHCYRSRLVILWWRGEEGRQTQGSRMDLRFFRCLLVSCMLGVVNGFARQANRTTKILIIVYTGYIKYCPDFFKWGERDRWKCHQTLHWRVLSLQHGSQACRYFCQ